MHLCVEVDEVVGLRGVAVGGRVSGVSGVNVCVCLCALCAIRWFP